MSLQHKIQQEIEDWEAKIQVSEDRVKRMKLEIKSLKHLLDMAREVESVER